MTHWKKAFKSDHLSSSDVDGKDLILTIKHVKYEECTTQGGKKFCNVAYFPDTKLDSKGKCISGTKPMILNVGNSKIVKGFSGNKTQVEEWLNIKIQVYVNPNVKFGHDIVEGLRIRTEQPKKQTALPKITDKNFANAIAYLKSGKSIAELKTLRSFDIVMEEKLVLESSL